MQTGEALILLVSSNIRRARRAAGISRKDAAARAGMPATSWSSIENGKQNITLETLARVSASLNVDVTVLLGNASSDTMAKVCTALGTDNRVR